MDIKVKITKLSNCESPRNPDNIENGFTTTGFMYDYPKEGDFFYLGNFRSSRVKKILNLTTFETQNSIYKLEEIDENTNRPR
jgi:hypothetical protein